MGVLTIALALTVLLILVACGDSTESVEVQETPAVMTTLSDPEQTEATVSVAVSDALSPTRSPYPAMPDTRSKEERLAQMEEALEPPAEEVTLEPGLPLGQDNVKLIDPGLSNKLSGLGNLAEKYPDIPSSIPLSEFDNLPDDVVLIYQEGTTGYERDYRPLPIYRIYKQDGELMREEIFTWDHPIFRSIEPISYRPWPSVESWQGIPASVRQFEVRSTPDGSRMVALACHRAACWHDGIGGEVGHDPDLPLPTTDIYESIDGGMTWTHADTIDRHWYPYAISDDQLLLRSMYPETESNPGWFLHILWPSKEPAPLPDLDDDRSAFITAFDELVSSIEEDEEIDLPGVLPIVFPGHPARLPTVHALAVLPIATISQGGEPCCSE